MLHVSSNNLENFIFFDSRAIELDSSNQVFYCNRAAAHSKLNNHYAAVEDCQRAIDMDPKYGKAYGRMGLAYSSIEKHKEAVECFKKAIDIEPDNESYQSNLKLAEEKLSSTGSPGAGTVQFRDIFSSDLFILFLHLSIYLKLAI